MKNLYKIMLVDDEEEVRTSIVKKIDWEEIGYTLVGDAENGEDALEKLDLFEPDVILTDIKMPFMDGLTMAKRASEIFPFVKIIIFSGFDEFEYAKEAIKLNVVEYILKPVNQKELTEILVKVKNNLDEERKLKRDTDKLRENYLKNLPVLKEQFLTDLLRGKLTAAEIEENKANYEIKLDKFNSVCVMFIEPMAEENEEELPFHKEKDLLPISVKALAEENFAGKFLIHALTLRGLVILITGMEKKENIQSFITLMNETCRECEKLLKLNVTAGIGKPYADENKIALSYKEARNALDYKAVVGSNAAIYIEDMEPIKKDTVLPKFEDAIETELLNAIKFGSAADITNVVKKINGEISQNALELNKYQAYLIGIMNAIINLVNKYELEMEDVIEENDDYVDIFLRSDSESDFESKFLKIAVNINTKINSERENTTKSLIRNAKDYIRAHFSEPDLSMEILCKELHISSSYFSTLFKKETGQSYVNFLTDTRLNYASELLSETDEKTYIIAGKSGYSDTNYFSYVFKKKFGVSPSKYRSSLERL